MGLRYGARVDARFRADAFFFFFAASCSSSPPASPSFLAMPAIIVTLRVARRIVPRAFFDADVDARDSRPPATVFRLPPGAGLGVPPFFRPRDASDPTEPSSSATAGPTAMARRLPGGPGQRWLLVRASAAR